MKDLSKTSQIGLVLAYILLMGYGLIALLRVWGLAVSGQLALECCAGWAACCFSFAYVLSEISLSRYLVRRPTMAEEDKLNGCFQEVLMRAAVVKPFRLLIQEEIGCNAFAIGQRTIVVSRGLLEKMQLGELKGVLAHELGHLESKDTLLGGALSVAFLLPRTVNILYDKAKRILVRVVILSARVFLAFRRFLLLLILITALLALLYFDHLFFPIGATILYVWAAQKASALTGFLWKVTSRFIEYRQDAYAFQLGYGTQLRQALQKLIEDQPQMISPYEILMRGDHPGIYNRIRRLEQLEGLR